MLSIGCIITVDNRKMSEKMRERTKTIRDYILELCRTKKNAVAAEAALHFGISKQSAAKHLQALELDGLVISTGSGKAKISELAILKRQTWRFKLAGLREDIVWRENVEPIINDLPENVHNIWHYGITEMINNAIDHSEGTEVVVDLERTALDTTVWIIDDGEGIFHRIQRLVGLYDPRESILELSKGKLTTDPDNHSGEGIFFTSRVFDTFSILSRTLYFSHIAEEEDWLIDDDRDFPGTRVRLKLANNCKRTLKEIMDFYAEPDEFTFSKTTVPVRLARHEGEKLVSRSQAKRLVARFEKFKTVVLDFEGVEEIGQGFADEIFRVFANSHPGVKLIPANVTPAVHQMIGRALAA